MEQEQLALFRERLPCRPYCTDDLAAGLIIRTKTGALRRRYVQINPPNLRFWLPFDIDREGGGLAWEEADLPMPNWSTVNRENGHAHLGYALEAPVLTSDAARQAPLRYLAAIESAYTAALEADCGFSGLIVKNPVHRHWQTLWGAPHLFGLVELAEYIELDRHKPRQGAKVEVFGLGRNCTLFEKGRHWAYRAVRRYWEAGVGAWHIAVLAKLQEMNGDFPSPLEDKEIRHISKSISKWTWQRFTPESFAQMVAKTHTSELQAARAARKGLSKREAGLAMLLAGKSPQEVSIELSVSRATAFNWQRSLKV